ncbi:hypothetical protein GGQ68_000569 [Sagittula marina]|uniref:Uncharacterized protein n=1 Tax=Sagittula marina TaxID=943940 RepID=A0A7W6GR67_9RHOB|nr:hypothetical protein [Sagittula marina]MBB3984258.1 hypothetical protein [Sagittula marina]
MSRLATIALCCLPLVAQAQPITVSDCDWQSNAQNIPEPWEAHSRTFANGNVRLTMLDTIEPALGWAWLMVQSPPEQDWGGRQCKLLGLDGAGFAGMKFDTLNADYDPSVGLMFSLLVDVFNPATGDSDTLPLWLTLNQSTGAIDAKLRHD